MPGVGINKNAHVSYSLTESLQYTKLCNQSLYIILKRLHLVEMVINYLIVQVSRCIHIHVGFSTV